MFTGLVEDVGRVSGLRRQGAGWSITIATALPIDEVALGDSIAVNGVCLTAESFVDGGFVAVAAAETMQKTALRHLGVGGRVHLERALRLGDRLGGHVVQGHVDGTGTVSSACQQRESWVMWVRMPGDLAKYVAPKGSITIDGVSLTVNEIAGDAFRVNIVPHTARETLLGERRAGDLVNLEVDVLAKYVERLLTWDKAGSLEETLRRFMG